MTDLRQAAQQALEALESGLAFDTHSDVLQNLRTALRTALEQQQAEPVAKLFGSLPVYDTTPPQRQWVGLTDEEIHRTTVLLGFNPDWKTEIGMAHAIVRNLETKLKERNT